MYTRKNKNGGFLHNYASHNAILRVAQRNFTRRTTRFYAGSTQFYAIVTRLIKKNAIKFTSKHAFFMRFFTRLLSVFLIH